MTEVILSEPPSRMQERVIWIDSEPRVGRAKPLGRMVSAAQIKALCGIGPSLFRADGDRPVSQADHFGVIVDVRVRPTKYLVKQISRCLARQRPCVVRVDHERLFEHRSRRVVVLLRPLLLSSHLQSAAAHGEIECVGISDALVSLRFRLDEFDTQRVR